ncbi:MAG: DUF3995 domain-containing protein [Deferribacterales bacterium]
MIQAVIWLGSLMMLFIAGLHFYWAMGGEKLSENVLPERPDGGKLFRPSAVGTFSVGLVLLTVAVSVSAPIFMKGLEVFWIRLAAAVIFFIRFVGDFRYVGLFKKMKSSGFARYDTLVYSPLSLFFAVVCFLSVMYF